MPAQVLLEGNLFPMVLAKHPFLKSFPPCRNEAAPKRLPNSDSGLALGGDGLLSKWVVGLL